MNTKPLTPKMHAISDYILVASLFAVPALLGMKKKQKLIFAGLGSVLLPYVAVTDQPLAVKPLIPFRTHGKIDVGNVAGIALLGMAGSIRKSKKARFFHAVFTTLGALTLLLTDFNSSPETTGAAKDAAPAREKESGSPAGVNVAPVRSRVRAASPRTAVTGSPEI